jgi:hypothetical protein
MPSESVCQVARSWVDSFHTRLVVRFMIFTASVRNILDTTSHVCVCVCVCVYIYIYIKRVCILAVYFHAKYVCRSNGSLDKAIRQKDKENLLIAAIMLFQLTQIIV